MGQIVSVNTEEPAQRQSVTLGGVQFGLRLTWRDRPGAWYADLWTAEGTPIWLGQRLSPDWALGFGTLPEGAPEGVLLVRGPSGYRRADLGVTLLIVYYPKDELPVAAVANDAVTVTVP